MSQLNYHHLRYFHAIVREGTLTRAAETLHVSQSALSIQLKKLEESLDCALFDRQHKSLSLTEEGRIVFDYAETIFRTGEELMATLQNKNKRFRDVLRVGAVSTLSKNFQMTFLKEAFDDEDLEVVIQSGSLRELLNQLRAHTIDLVLSNTPILRDAERKLHSQLLDKQSVSIVGPERFKGRTGFRFPEDLVDTPIVLPSMESNIRAGFDLAMERAGIAPLIAAEANDMAMMRLIARKTDALALVPPVVVMDELQNKRLFELCNIPDIQETFYAITATRRYPNPYLKKLLKHD
ncbi:MULTISPECIES: LysR family transcriptional regulator [unclassified Lentimonas]|uniref:LysR family transcriptional regulator n=1 Tax=unclassified Lentimonas TaxID=2630993 RepID=UPI00132A1629|nr:MULTISPECIES: LysR family transcriptional regulator [unclassified Lentimonas]CAA6676696.1 Hydrogen peroxide-inducible genes activator [Lentimonas sp. CC4]CAA6684640.1 Hydrogen peroxide-inducible genes activator [Lentimonas sp. CC6]CAA6694196.1 Hydrogen peroxide-inducible genes activator [Lentimonas sp. CC19]CAA6694308.1 Hydrogen peroxide-inducible genes activator [Lentimonas sp. CC10]CAA7070391.1 Hydrogen peroxide-inducible genes activator [Lentimonas sp. CC11]